MKYYKHLYLSEGLEKKKDKIIQVVMPVKDENKKKL